MADGVTAGGPFIDVKPCGCEEHVYVDSRTIYLFPCPAHEEDVA